MGAEPATHEDTTQDSISRHLRESGRKQEALKEALDGLDTDYPEDRNAILADNELLGELGVFSDESVNHLTDRSRPRLDFRDIPGREWSDERQRTMQVQTRMNAMNAHLNTRSTLAELRLLRGRLKKIEMMLAIVMALVVAMALSTLWKNEPDIPPSLKIVVDAATASLGQSLQRKRSFSTLHSLMPKAQTSELDM